MHYPQGAPIDPATTSRGSDQTGMRAYNERLILSVVRRHGAMPRADIARLTGLSAQTVSVIIRNLEQDGLLLSGEKQRGRVGQPSQPMMLNPDGVFSFGLKIGRRSAELVLVDFTGTIRARMHQTYLWPVPDNILHFTLSAIEQFTVQLTLFQQSRIAGLGIAMPFELWNWVEEVGAPPADLQAWQSTDICEALSLKLPFPVLIQNDATAACGAELTFGSGPDYADYVYFFIGSFIGGGVVLNNTLYAGRSGNAGALGSMPMGNGFVTTAGQISRPAQLIDTASLFILERSLKQQNIDTAPLWAAPDNWEIFNPVLDEWVLLTARSLAHAISSAASVIDFPAAIIDGWMPENLRAKIVETTRNEIGRLNLQGIIPPVIEEGTVGVHAKALGAARLPIFSRYLFDQNVLFKHIQ